MVEKGLELCLCPTKFEVSDLLYQIKENLGIYCVNGEDVSMTMHNALHDKRLRKGIIKRIRKANLSFPIILIPLLSGREVIVDGYHRLEKSRILKKTYINAFVIRDLGLLRHFLIKNMMTKEELDNLFNDRFSSVI